MAKLSETLFAAAVAVTTMSAAALAQTVPGTKRDLEFDQMMKTVNLEDPSLRLEYKKPTSDGSSIGFFIGAGNAPTDRSFVPTNSSSIPEAEVVSYRLARFLGISRNYYPVDYYTLGPKATAKFRDMVLSTKETSEDRIVNRDMVIKDLKANPNGVLGIYRIKTKTKMFTVTSFGMEGSLNSSTGIAQEIRADGRMPDASLLSLPEVKGGQKGFPDAPKEQRVEISRQLSNIFVVDQLLGQWDRFWNNLEASGDRNGRLKLVARDNGGANVDDWEGYETYNKWFSRFDKDMIAKLTDLNAFLKGAAPSFMGYTSPDSWQKAVGFITPSSFATFKEKLSRLIDQRVPTLAKRYGDKIYFPAKSAEIAAADAADTGLDD